MANYSSTENLTKKDGTVKGYNGIQGYIRKIIEDIPPGQSLALASIVKDLQDSGRVKDKHQAYVRVGNALKTLNKTYMRAVNKIDNYTYVVRIADIEEMQALKAEEKASK